jgi:hypothetical protein
MNEIRCVVCGSALLDPQGYKCGKCGGAIGPRHERCYVTEETKRKVLDRADELSRFGVRVERAESLQKSAGTALEVTGLLLFIVESLRPGTLRDCVFFLRELSIPEDEILRLRLDEPEQILTYYRMDRKQNGADARTPYGLPRMPRGAPRVSARASTGYKKGSKAGISSGTGRKSPRKKNARKQARKRS